MTLIDLNDTNNNLLSKLKKNNACKKIVSKVLRQIKIYFNSFDKNLISENVTIKQVLRRVGFIFGVTKLSKDSNIKKINKLLNQLLHDIDKKTVSVKILKSYLNNLDKYIGIKDLNILLVSSDLPNTNTLLENVKSNVVIIKYDYNRNTLKQLLGMVKKTMKSNNAVKISNVGLATHGSPGKINLVKGQDISVTNIQESFWKQLSLVLMVEGEIDILGCNVVSETDNLLSNLESITGKKINGSDDITGSSKLGGDWLLEKGNINLKLRYFNNSVDKWLGTMNLDLENEYNMLRSDLELTSSDIDHILIQIGYAEEFSHGVKSLKEIFPNTRGPYGLRTIDGWMNNLENENFGAVGYKFTRLLEPEWSNTDVEGLTYQNHGDVVDSSVRRISSAICDQDPHTNIVSKYMGVPMTGEPVIPMVATDEGLSASPNSLISFFGQFFDHGLDLIGKSSERFVILPLDDMEILRIKEEIVTKSVSSGVTNIPKKDVLKQFWGFILPVELNVVQFDNNIDISIDSITSLVDEAIVLVGQPFAKMKRAVLDNSDTSINSTTPFVDQNQTYGSHPSVTALIRQWKLDADGKIYSTGKLLSELSKDTEGNYLVDADGNLVNVNDNMATWAELKKQALHVLGINLSNEDCDNVPVLLTDIYGNLILSETGKAQLVIDTSNSNKYIKLYRTGIQGVIDELNKPDTTLKLITGDNTNPVEIPLGTCRSNQNMLLDRMGDIDHHFVSGDGRLNENIVLTALHAVFHGEHNRLANFIKSKLARDVVVTDVNDINYNVVLNRLKEYLVGDTTNIETTLSTITSTNNLNWNGNRIFHTSKFVMEMEYNRAVFDEFGPTISPMKDLFLGGPFGVHNDLDASISIEFSQSVYRFGHSLLRDNISVRDITNNNNVDINLFEGFIKPSVLRKDFIDTTNSEPLNFKEAVGRLLYGSITQTANQIDELITPVLQKRSHGFLDLPTLNIARGRDVGIPRLNKTRKLIYEKTHEPSLKPYNNWREFMHSLRTPSSIINFIVAYCTDELFKNSTLNLVNLRLLALLIVTNIGTDLGDLSLALSNNELDIPLEVQTEYDNWVLNNDPLVFMNRGDNGLEDIDLWVGGLAEAIEPFGSMLGTTMNYVFERQMEKLQNGDKYYYLARTSGMDLLATLETNSLTKIIARNCSVPVEKLPLNSFANNDDVLGINSENVNAVITKQEVIHMVTLPDDPNNPVNYLQYVGEGHVTVGGSDNTDVLGAGPGDDTVWGKGGDDWLYGFGGNDIIDAGDGNDIIIDSGGDDVLIGGEGNDIIYPGTGADVIHGGPGDDLSVLTADMNEYLAGPGDDFGLVTNWGEAVLIGGLGNDWLEIGKTFGAGESLLLGDNGVFPELTSVPEDQLEGGHDVLVSSGNNADLDGEAGDDIIVLGPGIDQAEGMTGFDWITFKNEKDTSKGVMVLLNRTVFKRLAITNFQFGADNDRYDRIEGVSGTNKDDYVETTKVGVDILDGTTDPNRLKAENMALIMGLLELIPTSIMQTDGSYVGSIILGAGGSDLTLIEENSTHLIDGDKKLEVYLEYNGNRYETLVELTEALIPNNPESKINPGDIQIKREIIQGSTETDGTDSDTIMFRGNLNDYVISAHGIPDIDGNSAVIIQEISVLNNSLEISPDVSPIIEHLIVSNLIGTTNVIIRNIEVLLFQDMSVSVPVNTAGSNGNHTNLISNPTCNMIIGGDTAEFQQNIIDKHILINKIRSGIEIGTNSENDLTIALLELQILVKKLENASNTSIINFDLSNCTITVANTELIPVIGEEQRLEDAIINVNIAKNALETAPANELEAAQATLSSALTELEAAQAPTLAQKLATAIIIENQAKVVLETATANASADLEAAQAEVNIASESVSNLRQMLSIQEIRLAETIVFLTNDNNPNNIEALNSVINQSRATFTPITNDMIQNITWYVVDPTEANRAVERRMEKIVDVLGNSFNSQSFKLQDADNINVGNSVKAVITIKGPSGMNFTTISNTMVISNNPNGLNVLQLVPLSAFTFLNQDLLNEIVPVINNVQQLSINFDPTNQLLLLRSTNLDGTTQVFNTPINGEIRPGTDFRILFNGINSTIPDVTIANINSRVSINIVDIITNELIGNYPAEAAVGVVPDTIDIRLRVRENILGNLAVDQDSVQFNILVDNNAVFTGILNRTVPGSNISDFDLNVPNFFNNNVLEGPILNDSILLDFSDTVLNLINLNILDPAPNVTASISQILNSIGALFDAVPDNTLQQAITAALADQCVENMQDVIRELENSKNENDGMDSVRQGFINTINHTMESIGLITNDNNQLTNDNKQLSDIISTINNLMNELVN